MTIGDIFEAAKELLFVLLLSYSFSAAWVQRQENKAMREYLDRLNERHNRVADDLGDLLNYACEGDYQYAQRVAARAARRSAHRAGLAVVKGGRE